MIVFNHSIRSVHWITGQMIVILFIVRIAVYLMSVCGPPCRPFYMWCCMCALLCLLIDDLALVGCDTPSGYFEQSLFIVLHEWVCKIASFQNRMIKKVVNLNALKLTCHDMAPWNAFLDFAFVDKVQLFLWICIRLNVSWFIQQCRIPLHVFICRMYGFLFQELHFLSFVRHIWKLNAREEKCVCTKSFTN